MSGSTSSLSSPSRSGVHILSEPEPGLPGSLLVVVPGPCVEAFRILKKLDEASHPRGDVKSVADQRADTIIRETVGACAAAAVAPTVSGVIQTSILVVGVARIARAYRVKLTRDEALAFIKDVLTIMGVWLGGALVGVKMMTAVGEAIPLSYFGSVAVDAVVVSAFAYTVGVAAKARFGHNMERHEMRGLVRGTMRRARREMRAKQKASDLPTEQKVPYATIHDVLQSEFGIEVILAIARQNPVVLDEVTTYLQNLGAPSLASLTTPQLEKMDKDTGLLRDLWDMVSLVVDPQQLRSLAARSAHDVEVLRALLALGEAGVVVDVVPEGAARKTITFPVGRPSIGVVYARHPVLEGRYYPVADFHRLSFEDKLCEAIRLLEGLGVEHLEVRHVAGLQTDVRAQLKAAGPLALTEAGGSSHTAQEREVEYEGDYPPRPPSLPENLTWYWTEPTWQRIAEGRLHAGLRSFELHVRYSDTFGVDAELVARLSAVGRGVRVGGGFGQAAVTDWKLSGTFHEERAEVAQ